MAGVRLNMTALTALRANVGPKTEEALDALALKVQAEAQGNIVRQDLVDTGMLLNDVTIQKLGKGRRGVGTGRKYGVHHEYGTRKMKARPWLRPALKAAEPLAKDLFGKVVLT